MNIIQPLKTLGQYIFDLVFPVNCAICGKDEKYLCNKCLLKLSKLPNQLCIVCKKPSPYGKTHIDCVSRNTVDGTISALSYKDHNVKRVIEIYKYKFIEELSLDLIQSLTNEIQNQGLKNFFQEFVLIPVPLHKKRFFWRGFNQSELLATSLSQKLDIPINKELVQRIKNTKPQTKLTADERKKNLVEAFSVHTDQNYKQKFLLIDDVITTGSTLNEIAKVLKQAGAQEVWAATVAHG